jgi:predicted nucleotidyltransferase
MNSIKPLPPKEFLKLIGYNKDINFKEVQVSQDIKNKIDLRYDLPEDVDLLIKHFRRLLIDHNVEEFILMDWDDEDTLPDLEFLIAKLQAIEPYLPKDIFDAVHEYFKPYLMAANRIGLIEVSILYIVKDFIKNNPKVPKDLIMYRLLYGLQDKLNDL